MSKDKASFAMRRARTIMLATTGLALTGPVMAQPSATGTTDPATVASPSTARPSVAEPGNADIIVTATKRSESLQNVPISIQALGTETLAQHQVQSFSDYAKLLPSVSYQSFGPGQTQLYFRGIVTGGDGASTGPLPATGLYVDETPLTTISGSVDLHVYDIARVEALAGPQGTLYGASSLSGTLRLITNKPDTTKLLGGFDVEGNKFGDGNYGGTAEGFINVPLGDRAAIRLVGFYERDGGYIDNTLHDRTYQRPHTLDDGTVENAPLTINNAQYAKKNFNDVDTYGGRAALKYDIDDNWTVTPAAIYQHQVAKGAFLFDPRAGDLEVHDYTPDFNRDHWYLASLTVQGKLSDWDVTYSGSYFRRHVDNSVDYSYFNVAYDSYTDYNYYKDAMGNDLNPTQTETSQHNYTKQSHELRISSPAEDPFRLTAGMFMQRQIDHRLDNYVVPGLATASVAFNTPIPGAPEDDVYYTSLHRVDRDYAVFAEAAYDILPNLTFTGGIRGFIAKNTIKGFSGGSGALDRQINLLGCTGTTVQECPNTDKKYIQSGETHKLNLTWKIDPQRLVYATYSTGFRPGGINRDAFALGRLQSIPPFKADTITNYELGWKTTWLNRTLRINGALFWEDWDKIQYSEPGILGIFYTVNAGRARSRGVEGDVNWTLFHHLTLSASGTYADAKLRTAFVGSDGTVLAPKGTRLPVNPRFKINGTARYDFETGDLKNFIQASVNHQSGTSQYLETTSAAILGPTKAFSTFDFSLGTAWQGYTLSAYIQNAFDKRGVLSKSVSCAIGAPVFCGYYARDFIIKPQIFGLRLGARFK